MGTATEVTLWIVQTATYILHDTDTQLTKRRSPPPIIAQPPKTYMYVIPSDAPD